MAKTLMLKLVALLVFVVLSIHFESAASFEDEENEEGEYVVDSVVGNMSGVRRSRFLISVIKKGTSCEAKKAQQICNGVWANKGTSLLYCCKKHCRNVLGDRNNCGQCGHKCRFGERCCAGVCTNVLYNNANCGKCNKRCRQGVKCGYGYCGYA